MQNNVASMWQIIFGKIIALAFLMCCVKAARTPSEKEVFAEVVTRSKGTASNEALPPEDLDGLYNHKDLYNWEKKKNLRADGAKKQRLELEVEEFFVEHEISEPSARAAAKDLKPEDMPSAWGCQECTKKEMEYCAGSQVMSDHCCCDKRYLEAFPYVPHTCYLGAVRCTTVASDCAEYARLRMCCCDKHLAAKWKAQLSNSATMNLPPLKLKWIYISLTTLLTSLTTLIISS